uniref:KIF-binding protein n=1 Tax=Stomoxys calcitrans TaxID=35570 RepID=A0A1I8NVE0_STOCA
MIPQRDLDRFKEIFKKGKLLLFDLSENAAANRRASIPKFMQLKEEVEKGISCSQGQNTMHQLLLAFTLRYLGYAYLACREANKAEATSKECIELMKSKNIEMDSIIPYVQSMIDLIINYNERKMYKKSIDYLTKAEGVCKKFEEGNYNPLTINEILDGCTESQSGQGRTEFNRLYTDCTDYLALTYRALDNWKKYFEYSYVSLKRSSKVRPYDDCLLAKKCTKFSDYFIKQNMFGEARRYLAAATYFITEYKEKNASFLLDTSKETELKKTLAKLGMGWGKYGLSLLLASMERGKRGDDYNFAENFKALKIEQDMPFLFPDLQLDSYEKDIQTDYCRSFKDAKRIYLHLIKWLAIPKEFYRPKDLQVYADVMKDFARLYHYVAYFEENPSNKFKMHKLRCKYLEEILKLIDSIIFLPISRECWTEAGFSYLERLQIIKQSLIGKEITSEDVNKIHVLALKGMKHFQNIISSYRHKESDLWIPNMTENDKKYLMISLSNMAQLHSAIISSDEPDHLSKCLYYHRTFILECSCDKQLSIELAEQIAHSKKEIYRLEKKYAL